MNEDFSHGSFFERLFRDATEAMVLLDDPDTILDLNQAFTALFGYCAAESLGKSLAVLLAGIEKIAESGEWTESLCRGEPLHTLAACRHRDGRSIQVHIRGHRFQHPSEYLCLFRPLERMETSNTETAISEPEFSDTTHPLANINRALRAPMNSILGFSELILASSPRNKCHTYAGMILSEAGCLLGLIDDLTDLKHLESGDVELNTLPFDLSGLLQNVAASVARQAEVTQTSFRTVIDPGVPTRLVGDAVRLRQVLVHLTHHAIRQTNQTSFSWTVKTTEKPNGRVVLRFLLECSGTDSSVDPSRDLFRRLQRISSLKRNPPDGSDYRFAVIHRLIEMMEGDYGLENRPGKGRRFWFQALFADRYRKEDGQEDLTLSQPRIEQVETEEPPAIPPKKILLVEDYPANQVLAREHLQNAGYEVRLAENGLQALQALRETTFDLIIMDVEMPEMDGLTAARRIRSEFTECAHLPILGMSADAYAHSLGACLQAGMVDVVSKPFSRKIFLSQVRKCLADFPSSAAGGKIGSDYPPHLSSINDPEEQPIDYRQALEEFGGNRPLLDGTLEQFVLRLGRQITDMHTSLQGYNSERLRREAHSIKGGAANLSARPLARAASALEDLVRKEASEAEIFLALQKIIRESQRLRNYLPAISSSAES